MTIIDLSRTRSYATAKRTARPLCVAFVSTTHGNVTWTDGQTDGHTDLLWLLQRLHLRAMRTRC